MKNPAELVKQLRGCAGYASRFRYGPMTYIASVNSHAADLIEELVAENRELRQNYLSPEAVNVLLKARK